jgi:hypothetical protein
MCAHTPSILNGNRLIAGRGGRSLPLWHRRPEPPAASRRSEASATTIQNIPAKAYDYTVNGKSAIEWIMERYQLTTHKESTITNNPNDWAKEVENPRYILDLLLSVINVSVQTMEIVEGLPELRFEESS